MGTRGAPVALTPRRACSRANCWTTFGRQCTEGGRGGRTRRAGRQRSLVEVSVGRRSRVGPGPPPSPSPAATPAPVARLHVCSFASARRPPDDRMPITVPAASLAFSSPHVSLPLSLFFLPSFLRLSFIRHPFDREYTFPLSYSLLVPDFPPIFLLPTTKTRRGRSRRGWKFGGLDFDWKPSRREGGEGEDVRRP